MSIVDFFSRKTVFSFEVFPPRRNAPIETIYETLYELQDLSPDFISVTYGAGGGENKQSTISIAEHINEICHVPSVVHFPCIGLTKEDVLKKIEEFKKAGIQNILALRGDIPEGMENKGDFRYASDLIRFLKENGDFRISAACYPEGHVECEHKEDDIQFLKEKVDAGLDFLTTQLFFDNNIFYNFLYRAREKGISVPIIAGIMPITRAEQLKRSVAMSGTAVPQRFRAIVDRFGERKEAMEQAGVIYAAEQIVDLIANGVTHIHVYTMNRPQIAERILNQLSEIVD